MPFTYAIDTPSPFAPLPEWRRFLAGLEHLPQDDDGIRFARNSARRRIAEIETDPHRENAGSRAVSAVT